jgi:hypothetical protein
MILAATSSPLGLVCATLLVIAVGVLLYGFIEFDRLVRVEHQFYREAWESDGSPCGFFWGAPGSFPFAGYFSRNRAAFRWLFRTPAWVATSPEHSQLLRRFRICVITWNVVCLPLALGIIASFK